MNITSFLYQLIFVVPAVLLSVSVHELSHGYASDRLGDPTPRNSGRLTLNPLKHLDPLGTLMLIIFHFGWAKPVIINPYYYRNRRRDIAIVSLAGPVSNFILAFISLFFAVLMQKYVTYSTFSGILQSFLVMLGTINIGLGIFNLIPIPPLDGSKILGSFLSNDMRVKYSRYENYMQLILLALLFLGVLTRPLSYLVSGMYNGFLYLSQWILGVGI